MFYNQSIKLVDFEPKFIYFSDKKNNHYKEILRNYALLVTSIWLRLGYKDVFYNSGDSIDEAKIRVKCLGRGLKRG